MPPVLNAARKPFIVDQSSRLLISITSATGILIPQVTASGQLTESFSIRIASANVAFNGLIIAPLAYLRVRNRSLLYVGANFAKLLIGLAFNVLFLVGLHMGVRGVFYSALIANAIVGAALTTMLVREVGIRFARSASRDLLRYGVPLIGSRKRGRLQLCG